MKCLISILLLIASLFSMTNSYNPYGQPQTYREKPNKKMVKYIVGQVCEEAMKQLVRETRAMRKARENKKNKEIAEEELFELTDDICNPYTNVGIWTTQFDIETDDKSEKLVLNHVAPDDIGECNIECETIAHTCSTIMEDNNIDIVEMLYADKKHSKLTNEICNKNNKYSKKEKKFIKNKKTDKLAEIVERDVWYPCDDERRKLIILQDAMPNDVQMFDPSMMSMEEMMERMKYSQGNDMDMPGMDGMPDMSELFGDMSEEEIEEMMKMYQESGMMDGMGGEYDDLDDMGFTPAENAPDDSSTPKKPKKNIQSVDDVGVGDMLEDAWDTAKSWAGGLFGSGSGSDKYQNPKSGL